MLFDNRYAWELNSDETYTQRHPQADEPKREAQNICLDMALEERS